MTRMAGMAEQSATIRSQWMPAATKIGDLRKAVINYRLAENQALLAIASSTGAAGSEDAMAAAAARVDQAYDEYRPLIIAGRRACPNSSPSSTANGRRSGRRRRRSSPAPAAAISPTP